MRTYKGRVLENSAATLLARVQDNDGADITAADISTITVKTYKADGTLVATVTPTVADVVYDTLQTDARWTGDGGYNVALPLEGTNWPEPGIYRVIVTYTPASGYAYADRWELTAVANDAE